MAPTRGPIQKTCGEEGGSQGARGRDGGVLGGGVGCPGGRTAPPVPLLPARGWARAPAPLPAYVGKRASHAIQVYIEHAYHVISEDNTDLLGRLVS